MKKINPTLWKAKWLDFKKEIYRFFHIPLYTKKQYAIYSGVEIADLVFCKMNYSEETLLTVPKGHQYRPYLIVGKSDGYLIGFPGSHKKWDKTTISRTLIIKKEGNPIHLTKDGYSIRSKEDSYVDLTRLTFIPIENISHIQGHVNHHYMNELGKKLMIMSNNGSSIFKINYPFDFHLEVGDIVEVEDVFYYIYSRENITNYGYAINRELTEIPVSFGGQLYYLHIENRKEFKDNEFFSIFYTSNEEQIRRVAELIEITKNKNKPKHFNLPSYKLRMKPGTLFTADFREEKYVYLFTLKNKDYVVDISEIEEYLPHIEPVKDLKYFTKKGKINHQLLLSIFEDLLDRDGNGNDEIDELIEYLYLKEKRNRHDSKNRNDSNTDSWSDL